MSTQSGMVDPSIFQYLQERIDEETAVKDELREILQILEKQTRSSQSILARAHSTPSKALPEVVSAAEGAIRYSTDSISKLAEASSKQPYYKWNSMWSRQVQDTVATILFCAYLGGLHKDSVGQQGKLLSIDEVGKVLNVPVNLKDRDAFHLTIEEYLHALISLIEDLGRLARNSVTLGDYQRPLQIAQSVKDVHAGFQLLNLKNDSLRKRSDAIKYKVKEVEDVVYDLSLRGLLPSERK